VYHKTYHHTINSAISVPGPQPVIILAGMHVPWLTKTSYQRSGMPASTGLM